MAKYLCTSVTENREISQWQNQDHCENLKPLCHQGARPTVETFHTCVTWREAKQVRTPRTPLRRDSP